MLAAFALCAALTTGQSAVTATPSVEAAFQQLIDDEWERTMRTEPTWASRLGDRRFNSRWEDLRLTTLEKEHARDREVLKRLKQIDRGALSAAKQLTYDLFEKNYATRIEAFPFGGHLLAINQRDGIQTIDELADALRFETKQDYEDWLQRLQSFGDYTDQTLELLREGVKRGIVQPKIVMQRVPAQIDKQLVAKPEDSPLYKPFRRFPRDVSADDRAALQAAAAEAVSKTVLPAFARLKKFFTDEYFPACQDQTGALHLPNGKEYYAFCARRHTTTELTPAQIHEIGLAEVARIRGEMEKVKAQAGFKGSLGEFFHFLRTDPQFFCKDERELLFEYQAVSKQIDPLLVKLFRTLPRIPYGVEAIPMKIAPDTTAAYYRQPAADGSRAGTYFVNLYRPETRPKWEMMALSLHEAVPGHHLQIALATELTDLPQFRRYSEYTAYVEGWALYAEALGEEMGLYEDPYVRFGRLTYEMWRAVRLVVDTGLHDQGWSRDKAIEFFKANAPKVENDIVNEIDRYISWPGQALAYKIGELKIKELRKRAETKLGAKFDIKGFHDVLLLSGAVPLDVLERCVDAWVAERQ